MEKIRNALLTIFGMALTATSTFTLLFFLNRPVKTPESQNDDPVSLPEEPVPEERTYTLTFTGDISLADNWHIAPKYDERGGVTGILGSTMLDAFDGYKIPHIGAGRNLKEAKEPYFLTLGNYKFAFVAATRAEKNVMTPQATSTAPGTFWCYDPAEMIDLIKDLKNQVDFVIPVIHFGRENSHELEQAQMDSARAYIDAGAAMVVGHHAHNLQGVEIYQGKPIIYNLGNFLFNYVDTDTALFQVKMDQDGKMEYYILPAFQTNCQTILLEEGAKKQQIISDINSWSINAGLDSTGKIMPAS